MLQIKKISLRFRPFVNVEISERHRHDSEELVDAQEVPMQGREDDLGCVALLRDGAGNVSGR